MGPSKQSRYVSHLSESLGSGWALAILCALSFHTGYRRTSRQRPFGPTQSIWWATPGLRSARPTRSAAEADPESRAPSSTRRGTKPRCRWLSLVVRSWLAPERAEEPGRPEAAARVATGGGAIHLEVKGDLIVDGTIDVRGQEGTGGEGGGGGSFVAVADGAIDVSSAVFEYVGGLGGPPAGGNGGVGKIVIERW